MHRTHAALATLAPGVETDRRGDRVVIDEVHEGEIDAHARPEGRGAQVPSRVS